MNKLSTTLISLIATGLILLVVVSDLNYKKINRALEEITQSPPPETIIIKQAIITPETLIRERVTLTSYYPGDPYASHHTTSSGLTTQDFQINENGWYTYKNYVVIAAATHLCVQVNSGACAPYEYQDTHHYFDIGDTLHFIYNNKTYDAIVLDSCGACNWDEPLQRIDIFVSNKQSSVGKIEGSILYPWNIKN